MIKRMPIILILLIGFVLFFSRLMPLNLVQGLYALSLSIKTLLIMLLPFLIFALLYKAARSLAQSASAVILLIFGGLIASNAVATFLSQFVGRMVYHVDLSMQLPQSAAGLTPLWLFEFPTLIPNPMALMAGLLFGFASRYFPDPWANKLDGAIEKGIHHLLNGFAMLVPFFVTGFVAKMQADGLLGVLFHNYAVILGVIALSQIVYITSLYLITNRFNLRKALMHVKDMLPAAFTGFSTMSSAAAMPLTILATEKNTKHKVLARSTIPATVNVHLMGDCIAIPILAFAILKQFNLAEPTLMQYLIFVGYFVLAKFSVAAIPGGGILVMLPILESYLGFNGEMLALITALYILFDPVITTFNVLGNGAFAKGIDNAAPLLKKGDLEAYSTKTKAKA